LAQVFAEYDIEVRKAASNHKLSRGQVREYSAGDANSRSQGPPSDGPPPSNKNERVQKLKAAVRDYGSTVIVFHVGISLMSLGGFYLLVARYKTTCLSYKVCHCSLIVGVSRRKSSLLWRLWVSVFGFYSGSLLVCYHSLTWCRTHCDYHLSSP